MFYSMTSSARASSVGGTSSPSARALYREGQSALAELSGVSERIFHAVPDLARNFDTVSARP